MKKRESFNTRWGFILACIGSAVGMGNIWMFPTRVSLYGGGAFLIPYFIFVALIGFTGVIGEMTFGRATRSGPIDAFGMACERKGKRKPGEALGLIPVVGSLAMAIGYTVVMGWILKYTVGAFTGATLAPADVDEFSAVFGSMASAFGNTGWQVVILLAAMGILMFGVGGGIEKVNKVLMPVFFLLFVGLGIYVAFQPGAVDGYHYIFRVDGKALFDTLAALLASLVIIPAMATTGAKLDQGGPGLLFIFLPNLIKNMPGGKIIVIIFFVAVLFAGLTSLINLYEAPIATVQEKFHLERKPACAVIAVIGVIVSILIQGIVSGWMDVLSIYICPLGAGLAGIMLFWVCGKEYVEKQVNKGRSSHLTSWFYPICKYVYVPVCILVLILGIALGGIG